MPVRILNEIFVHDEYINPCFLGDFSCFLKLIFVFPDLGHGPETFGSVWKLFETFLGLLGGFSADLGSFSQREDVLSRIWVLFFAASAGETASFLEFAARGADMAP